MRGEPWRFVVYSKNLQTLGVSRIWSKHEGPAEVFQEMQRKLKSLTQIVGKELK